VHRLPGENYSANHVQVPAFQSMMDRERTRHWMHVLYLRFFFDLSYLAINIPELAHRPLAPGRAPGIWSCSFNTTGTAQRSQKSDKPMSQWCRKSSQHDVCPPRTLDRSEMVAQPTTSSLGTPNKRLDSVHAYLAIASTSSCRRLRDR